MPYTAQASESLCFAWNVLPRLWLLHAAARVSLLSRWAWGRVRMAWGLGPGLRTRYYHEFVIGLHLIVSAIMYAVCVCASVLVAIAGPGLADPFFCLARAATRAGERWADEELSVFYIRRCDVPRGVAPCPARRASPSGRPARGAANTINRSGSGVDMLSN